MIDAITEARLLAALRGDDRAAYDAAIGELHARTARPLFQLCLRVACDATDADDAVQETFVDVLRGVRSFRGEAKLSTWLFRIAIRAATRVRNRSAARRHAVTDASELPGDDDPVARASDRENAARLLAAIDQLPAAQRAVVGLAAIEGIAHAEIADVLGIPVGTVGSRLHEARDRLRALLTERRSPG
ncbi:MAG: sigma-70 family RNA polymerase sigma factor [Planctomycetes bacterium]|nr:sigma-70 family RNA polymerase sigma factor [Planctomycetota bacterium]